MNSARAISSAPAPSTLNTDARTPLYQQLVERLEQDIRHGVYGADKALPSERALVDLFGVSRVTARKAIDVLVAQGRVLRRHGAGNFVAPRLAQTLSRVSSFSQELRQRGVQPSSRWLARDVRAGTARECEQLALAWPAQVAGLERLRLADGVPVALEISALPLPLLPTPDTLQDSLYEHLAATGNAPVRALQHIRALNADAQLARLLDLPLATALLWVTRTAYRASDEPVEFTVAYCRSDYYDFVVEMRGI
jgi:GntR family transcriptional regulator